MHGGVGLDVTIIVGVGVLVMWGNLNGWFLRILSRLGLVQIPGITNLRLLWIVSVPIAHLQNIRFKYESWLSLN